MTHPITPCEKVELKPCPFCGGDAVAGSNFDNDHYVMCGADCDKCGGMVGYMKTEMAAIENWNRRTALASGSGDHADLARLAEAASPGDWWSDDDVISHQEVAREDERFIYAMSPATVLSLLAEIAALRGENDRLAFETDDATLAALQSRATEAERKLAEAVGLNERAADLMRQCTDPERFEGVSTLNVYANMWAWLSSLSKEAERG